MMKLPKRRERPRSGIERAPQREWDQHRRYIRSRECAVLSYGCIGRVECAHVRHGTDGGTGIKPSDFWCVPLCSVHHAEQHRIGEPAFEKRHNVNLKRIALGLARQSPDLEMRKVLREIEGGA